MLEVADPSLLINLKPDFFSEIAQILNDDVSRNASKAALKVLVAACPWGRNRIKAVEAGVVAKLIDMLLESSEKRECGLIMAVLDMAWECADGRAERRNSRGVEEDIEGFAGSERKGGEDSAFGFKVFCDGGGVGGNAADW